MSESPMALNGLISVPTESNKQLPTEVSEELASIQDAGIRELFLKLTVHSLYIHCMMYKNKLVLRSMHSAVAGRHCTLDSPSTALEAIGKATQHAGN